MTSRWMATTLVVACALTAAGCGVKDGRLASAVASEFPSDSVPASSASSLARPSAPSTAPSSTPSAEPEVVPGSVATQAGPVALGERYLGPLTYRWPVGCTVRLTEATIKDDSTATLTYGLELVAEGPNLVVSFVDMMIADVNGQPMSAADATAQVMLFKLPNLVVDPQGTVVETRGVEELLDAIVATGLADASEITLWLAAALETALVSNYWGSWAGAWATRGTIDAPHVESVLPTAVGDTQFNMTVVVESLGTTPGGLAMMRQTQIVEGEDLLLAMGVVTAALGADEVAAAMAETSGRRIVTLETTTDPLTLRPLSASLTQDIELTTNGGSRKSSRTQDMDLRLGLGRLRCVTLSCVRHRGKARIMRVDHMR